MFRTPGTARIGLGEVVRPGDVIDGFTVLRPIGSGGMGVVFEARQLRPERSVALKFLTLASERTTQTRFELEIEALGRLDHPGIAQVLSSGRHRVGGREIPYFAMEFVRGQSIVVWAASVDADLKLDAVAQLAAAVQHAHEHAVIHRDLKPDNVLVDERGRVRLLDFGIAKLDDDLAKLRLTATGDRLFTAAYAAPEQVARRFGEIGQRTDVYALGLLAYEVLVGERAYEVGDSLEQVVRRVTDTLPDPRPLAAATSTDVCRVVLKALSKQPGERYGSAREFAEDLERARSGRAVHAMGRHRGYVLRKFLLRHRVAVAVTSIFVAAILVSSAIAGIGWARSVRAGRELRMELRLGNIGDLQRAAAAGRGVEARRGAWRELVTVDSEPLGRPGREMAIRELLWLLRGSQAASGQLADISVPPDTRLVSAAYSSQLHMLLAIDEHGTPHRLDVRAQSWSRPRWAGQQLIDVAASGGDWLLLSQGKGGTARFQRVMDDGAQGARSEVVTIDDCAAPRFGKGPAVVVICDRALWLIESDHGAGRVIPVESRSLGAVEVSGGRLISLHRDGVQLIELDGERTTFPVVVRKSERLQAYDAEHGQFYFVQLDGLARLGADSVSAPMLLDTESRRSHRPRQLTIDAANRELLVFYPNGVVRLRRTDEAGSVRELGARIAHPIEAWSHDSRLVTLTRTSVALWDTTPDDHVDLWTETGSASRHSVAFASTGDVLAGRGSSSANLESADSLVSVDHHDGQGRRTLASGHTKGVTGLVTLDGASDFFSIGADGQVLRQRAGEIHRVHEHGVELSAIVADRERDRLAVAGALPVPGEPNFVTIVGFDGGNPLRLPTAQSWVKGLALSPGGRRLAACGNAGVIELWEFDSAGQARAEQLGDPGPIQRALAWSTDGRWIAAGNDRGAVDVYDVTHRRLQVSFAASASEIYALAFSPTDPTLLASASADGEIRLWDAATGRPLMTLADLSTRMRRSILLFDLAFSADGSRLAFAGSGGGVGTIDLTYHDAQLRELGQGDLSRLGIQPERRRRLWASLQAAGLSD